MQSIAAELRNILDTNIAFLRSLQEGNVLLYKASPTKWSKKEILGHLVDSAQNNIRRFIVAQYEHEPHIVYNQDQWVTISNYQQYPFTDLVELWYLLNNHICIILENINPEAAQRKSRSENLQSIEWLAQDYIKHLRHHLHQVLDLEKIAYP